MAWSLFESSSSADSRGAETGQQTSGASSPALNLSNVELYKNAEMDLSVALSDYGAIDAGLDFAGESGQAAYEFAAGAGSAYTEALGDSVDNAFMFAAGAGENAAGISLEALNAMRETGASAIQSSEALSRAYMDNTLEAQDDAYEFVAGGTLAAFEAAENAQTAVDAIAARSLDSVAEAYGTSAEVSQASMIMALDASDRAAARSAAAFEKASEAVESANTSENAKLSSQVIYGAMALLALVAWRAAR